MGRFTSDLDDKTRLLMKIISRMAFNACKWGHEEAGTTGVWTKFPSLGSAPPVGSLVVCQTSGIHDWTVAFVADICGKDACGHIVLLREIGSNRTCRMGNESYYTIHGLCESDLLEGQKYQFYRLCHLTIGRLGDDWRRFSHIEFMDDTLARVFIREKFGGGQPGSESQPFPIEIVWNRKRLSQKTLFVELEAGGYSTREFVRTPKAESHGSVTMIEPIGHGGTLVTTIGQKQDDPTSKEPK